MYALCYVIVVFVAVSSPASWVSEESAYAVAISCDISCMTACILPSVSGVERSLTAVYPALYYGGLASLPLRCSGYSTLAFGSAGRGFESRE